MPNAKVTGSRAGAERKPLLSGCPTGYKAFLVRNLPWRHNLI